MLAFIAIVFLLPAAAHAAWWALGDHPASWRDADWSSSGVLPPATADAEPAVYLMAARTGGLKGAFAVHSWMVLKPAGAGAYERYDVVGWGNPVRLNAQPADGLWYSNRPRIVHSVRGKAAGALVERFKAAIDAYPYSNRGDYRVWPGPNSNTFTAWLMEKVPEFGAAMPSTAVGRDFIDGPASIHWSPETYDLTATAWGLVGFAVGARRGIELQFAGLVAGVDFARPALKIPAIGRLPLAPG